MTEENDWRGSGYGWGDDGTNLNGEGDAWGVKSHFYQSFLGRGSGWGEGGGDGDAFGYGNGEGEFAFLMLKERKHMIEVYRDGISYKLDEGSKVSVRVTSDGHTIESWKSDGKRVYFANLRGGIYCAHGDTAAQAIGDALWKDKKKRPKLEDLVAKIKPKIKTRKITVMEFRLLTGACASGCEEFLRRHNLPLNTSMTLSEFMPIGGDWALKLKEVLS